MSSRFETKVGIDEAFFEPCPLANIVVEAPIEEVSGVLAGARFCFRMMEHETLDVEKDVFDKPFGDDHPLVSLFQLDGHGWTQLGCDLRLVQAMRLARLLSHELRARCLCVEVTDDAYYAHAFVNRGILEDLFVDGMKGDVEPSLKVFDIDVPPDLDSEQMDEMDQFDEVEFNYRRGGTKARELEALVAEAGCFLQAHFGTEGVHGVADLTAEDLVRMDVVWKTAND